MYVLQLCHDYKAPFLSVAAQYASLFEDTPYKVITVFLKGVADDDVIQACKSEKVIFLNYQTKELRGLKRKAIRAVRELNDEYSFKFAIAQRYKALYIASHVSNLFCIGVHHIRGGYNRIGRRLYIYSKKKQIALLGVSKAVRDDIRKDLKFIDSNRIQHLYNSLDFPAIRESLYSRDEARKQLNLSKNSYIIGTVGRLHQDKDQATLIRAFEKIHTELPDARLALIGVGPLENTLQKQVSDAGLESKVIFLGRVENAYRYIPAFDCFVLSSIREGLPVALLEAFAAKTICLASRCDGNEEAMEGVGEVFEIKDTIKLAKLLKNVYFLSDIERNNFLNRVENKINSNFTDACVKANFWTLPFIKSKLPQIINNI